MILMKIKLINNLVKLKQIKEQFCQEIFNPQMIILKIIIIIIIKNIRQEKRKLKKIDH